MSFLSTTPHSQTPTKQPAHLQPSTALLSDRHVALRAAAAAAAAAVEGNLLLPEQPERREFGAAQIIRPIKDGGGGGHFGNSAGRELQAPPGGGFGSEDDVGAGSGLTRLLLPFEGHRGEGVERRRRCSRGVLRRERGGEFVCGLHLVQHGVLDFGDGALLGLMRCVL